jgi:drug/metabolite transporter (DMT)-like permease
MADLFGPLLVLTFCLSQALRDVYFANVFQGIGFFPVLLLTAMLSTAIFGALTAARAGGEFAKLYRYRSIVLGMNVTTAVAWSSYFFGLTHLDPSIVNTVHTGVAPLTVIALSAVGVGSAEREVVRPLEHGCYVGMTLALAGLWWVALSGNSGLPVDSIATTLRALTALVVGGASITLSLVYSKRLTDHGVSAKAVTAVRYVMAGLLAGCAEALREGGVLRGGAGDVGSLGELATLAVSTIMLIVLPTFALQAGLARTPPLTAHVIRALGPVCVFALAQLDGRIAYSAPTLICIVAYSIFVIAGNVAHGWRPVHAERVVAGTS